MTGYGVALDLKKTDYLALDDRRASSTTSENDKGIENPSIPSNELKLTEFVPEEENEPTDVLAVESDDGLILDVLQSLPEVTNITHYTSPLESEELLGGFQCSGVP